MFPPHFRTNECSVDLMQLVTEAGEATEVVLWNDQKKIVVDAAGVATKFGVRPAQMADFLALTGDASDNVEGVPGIGPKNAAALLAEHETLEAVLEAAQADAVMKPSKRRQALRDFAGTARRALEMVSLRADVPLDDAAAGGGELDVGRAELADFLYRWELRQVEGKVQALRSAVRA